MRREPTLALHSRYLRDISQRAFHAVCPRPPHAISRLYSVSPQQDNGCAAVLPDVLSARLKCMPRQSARPHSASSGQAGATPVTRAGGRPPPRESYGAARRGKRKRKKASGLESGQTWALGGPDSERVKPFSSTRMWMGWTGQRLGFTRKAMVMGSKRVGVSWPH